MQAGDPLGHVEFAVLNAVHGGTLRSYPNAQRIGGLRQAPAGQVILHEVLRRCERSGLVRSRRNTAGRRYELTAAGRARLRADRQFRAALIRVLLRGHRPPDGRGGGA